MIFGDDEEEVRGAVASAIGKQPGDGLRDVDIVRHPFDLPRHPMYLPYCAHLYSELRPEPSELVGEELFIPELYRDPRRLLIKDVIVRALL